MGSDEENKPKTWGTWEELLLACAVKRHGFKNWDSVSTELQTKTSLPHLLTTAQCCKQKYHDLKRRFKDEQQEYDHSTTKLDKAANVPWLEHLRKVRVDELKQEVQRYDLSILSLQRKVKRLEEEREPALEIKTTQPKPDLDDQNILKTEEAEKSGEPDKVCKRLVSGEGSDRENGSVNESNSTGVSEKKGGGELKKKEGKTLGSGEVGGVESGWKAMESEELGDSVTQLSSDMQSSASYGEKRKRSSGDSLKKRDVKSEPLMGLLDLIRSHKGASLFEGRLKIQESNKYKETVRQHVDLETIETRLQQGSYSSCILKFYRDVLLLFNNAIVYFPKTSPESATAFQLRNLVSNEIKKENPSQEHPPPPPSTPDSLLAKHKSSAPIIVCRKRSSVPTKPSTSSTFAQQQGDDNKLSVERNSGLLKVKTEEKVITTGARSSRRSSRNPPPPPPTTNRKPNGETSKADKKKSEASTTSDKKKSVVDFLKRIKKNSPVQTSKKSRGEEQKKKDRGSSEKKVSPSTKEENSPSKKAVGRPPKTSGKRGAKEVEVKRQSKRARR